MILLLKVLVMYYVLLCETLIRCSQPTINSVICRVNIAYYQVYCKGKTLTLMSSHSLTMTIVQVVQVSYEKNITGIYFCMLSSSLLTL